MNTTTRGDSFSIEVLACGRAGGGVDVTRGMLDAIARNAALLRGKVTPALRVGLGERVLAGHGEDSDPALGYVTNLRRVGEKLIGDVTNAPSVVKQAVRSGHYRKLEAHLYPAWENTPYEANLKSGATGPVLSSVAITGWNPPVVRTLQDLNAFLHGEVEAGKLKLAETNGATVVTLDCAGPRPRTRLDALEHDVVALVEQTRQLKERAQALTGGQNIDMAETKSSGTRAYFVPGTVLDDAAIAGPFADAIENLIQLRHLNRESEADRRGVAPDVLSAWASGDDQHRQWAAELTPHDFQAAIWPTYVAPGPVPTISQSRGYSEGDKMKFATAVPGFVPDANLDDPATARMVLDAVESYIWRHGLSRDRDRRAALHAVIAQFMSGDAASKAAALALTPRDFKAILESYVPVYNAPAPVERAPVGTATSFPTPAPGYRQPGRMAEGGFIATGHHAAVAKRMGERGGTPVYGSRAPWREGHVPYGSGTKPPAPKLAMSETEEAAAGERFETAIAARLSEIDAAPTDDAARAAAAAYVMERHPEWTPRYGAAGKRQRGPVMGGSW